MRDDPAYKAAQRDADACWHENSAPNYHKEYRADLKKPAAERRPRRRIRPRRRRRRTITLALGTHELRVSVVPARSRPADGARVPASDVELALVRIRRAADEDSACADGAKDGRVPARESLTGSSV